MDSVGSRIRALREARKLSQSALARMAKVSQPVIAELESGLQASSKKLPEIAAALGVNVSDLDERYQPAAFRPAPTFFSPDANMPVYAAAEGGGGHLIVSTDPIEYVPRPHTLQAVEDAYAILIVGESMVPAFEPGDTAWVNPRLPRMRDADAIFYALGEAGYEKATIKRLVGWTDTDWTVKQWNPPKSFKLSRLEWPKAHRVVGKFSRR